MTQVPKIDSDLTALAFAEEATYGVLPGTPTWRPLEPNSYGPFGGEIKVAARNPINADRQRRRSVTVDLDGKGEFESDLTPSNLTELLQGAFFANLRKKAEVECTAGSLLITGVTNADSTYTVVSANGSNFRANDLIFCKGFTNAANNGLSKVSSSTATTIVSTATLADETPVAGAKIVVVGHEFASGDAEINVPVGDYPQLTTTTKDLTQLGLIPGEMVFIGGDASGNKFATAANNGYARVRSVAAHVITFDKTYATMVTDDGSGKTIRLFFGRVLKNETGANIVRKSYNLERQLSYPDDSNLSQIQSEYVVGAVFNMLELNMKESDKVTAKLTFVGKDHETRDGATGVKSGNRLSLVSEDAFSTSSDLSVCRVAAYSGVVTNLTPLVGYIKDSMLKINNNVSGLKAIGELGNFETSAGVFEVSCNINGYFGNISAMSAVRANTLLTADYHFCKDNSGISIDLPALVCNKSLADVKQNEPVMLPLDGDASTGYDVHPSLNHTMLMVFFDYLPSAADT
jgi:hypothetical protein